MPRNSDPLPRSPRGRLLVAALALPSFLVSTACLLAIPSWTGTSPGVGPVVILVLLGELFAFASAFTLLALWWSIATPAWIPRLLQDWAGRLLVTAGIFLIAGGGVLLPVLVPAQSTVPAIIISVGVAMGIVMLAAARTRTTQRD